MTTVNHTSGPARTDPAEAPPGRRIRVGWLDLLVAASCGAIASFVAATIIAGSIEMFLVAMTAPFVA